EPLPASAPEVAALARPVNCLLPPRARGRGARDPACGGDHRHRTGSRAARAGTPAHRRLDGPRARGTGDPDGSRPHWRDSDPYWGPVVGWLREGATPRAALKPG